MYHAQGKILLWTKIQTLTKTVFILCERDRKWMITVVPKEYSSQRKKSCIWEQLMRFHAMSIVQFNRKEENDLTKSRKWRPIDNVPMHTYQNKNKKPYPHKSCLDVRSSPTTFLADELAE